MKGKTQKKCKGVGRAKGHGCGILVPVSKNDRANRVYGLGMYPCGCYQKWLLNTEEGKKKLEETKLRAAKKVKAENEKRERRQRREEKEALIDYRGKLQTKIQEMARRIDYGQPCLARGYHPDQMHGGHIFSKGSSKTISLNLHNVHRQSAQSNRAGNDDGLLRERLVNEYGQDYFDFLSQMRRCQALKYSNIEYKAFYEKACRISTQMKRSGKTYSSPKERIKMRNNINSELGIYPKEFSIYDL